MAAPMKSALGSFRNLLSSNKYAVVQTAVREASKKSGGNTKNKIGSTNKKRRGPKKQPGDYVEPGMILMRQLGLKFYPGENVGCGRDNTLYARSSGIVTLSREKLAPYPYSPLYKAVLRGQEIHKIFYHVLPEKPQSQNFKLVSQT